jgi:hypothetical protein
MRIKRDNIRWLAIGLARLIGFLVFFFIKVKGIKLNAPALYFLDRENVLYLIQEDGVETISLTEIDLKYLFDNFQRASTLEKAGAYLGLAGSTIILGGEIASILLYPLYPLIKSGTRIFGMTLGAIGAAFIALAEDEEVSLLPATLYIFPFGIHERINIPKGLVIFARDLSKPAKTFKIVEGYLLGYSQDDIARNIDYLPL